MNPSRLGWTKESSWHLFTGPQATFAWSFFITVPWSKNKECCVQLEDGITVMFFTLFIDLSTAVHRSEGFRCVSQIPLKSTLIYSLIWLLIVTRFFPMGLDVTHGFTLAFFKHCVSVAGLIKRWSASSLLLDDFFFPKIKLCQMFIYKAGRTDWE